MLLHLFIGGVAVYLFMFLVNQSKRSERKVEWWQWLLTVLGFLYGILVLETIYGFLAEGAVQAALVMGMTMTVIAVIWGVLLGRFVFLKKAA